MFLSKHHLKLLAVHFERVLVYNCWVLETCQWIIVPIFIGEDWNDCSLCIGFDPHAIILFQSPFTWLLLLCLLWRLLLMWDIFIEISSHNPIYLDDFHGGLFSNLNSKITWTKISSKKTKTYLLSCSLNISFINDWKVAGAFLRPNGMTKNS